MRTAGSTSTGIHFARVVQRLEYYASNVVMSVRFTLCAPYVGIAQLVRALSTIDRRVTFRARGRWEEVRGSSPLPRTKHPMPRTANWCSKPLVDGSTPSGCTNMGLCSDLRTFLARRSRGFNSLQFHQALLGQRLKPSRSQREDRRFESGIAYHDPLA